jgi:hypothetical protein
MASEIPQATLAAGDQSDPAWWLEAAKWHETSAVEEQREAAHAPTQTLADYHEVRSHYSSAAALACRTFAAMMERAQKDAYTGDHGVRWLIDYDGDAVGLADEPEMARTLPAAAVAALTEDA